MLLVSGFIISHFGKSTCCRVCLHFILSYLAEQPAAGEDNDDLTTFIEVMGYNHSELPLGQNVTVICKTKLEKASIWWHFQDKNLTREQG